MSDDKCPLYDCETNKPLYSQSHTTVYLNKMLTFQTWIDVDV